MKTHSQIQDGIVAANIIGGDYLLNWWLNRWAYDDNGCYEIDKDLHAQKAEVERMGYHFFRVNAVKAEAA
jgi:hypothetical protein